MRNIIYIILTVVLTINFCITPAFDKSKKKIISLAEQGDVEWQYELATMYESGKRVKQNTDEALSWFNKAAENGHIASMIDLGWFYQNGQYVEKDIHKAIEWYQRASEQGDPQA
jgi:TPR repeat protein